MRSRQESRSPRRGGIVDAGSPVLVAGRMQRGLLAGSEERSHSAAEQAQWAARLASDERRDAGGHFVTFAELVQRWGEEIAEERWALCDEELSGADDDEELAEMSDDASEAGAW